VFLSAGPKFIQQPKDLIANEGTTAKFSCIAVGEPQPNTFWIREGKGTPMFPQAKYDGRYFVTKSGELEISNVQRGDEGIYSCTALSQSGNIQAKAQLTVIGKSVLNQHLLIHVLSLPKFFLMSHF